MSTPRPETAFAPGVHVLHDGKPYVVVQYLFPGEVIIVKDKVSGEMYAPLVREVSVCEHPTNTNEPWMSGALRKVTCTVCGQYDLVD